MNHEMRELIQSATAKPTNEGKALDSCDKEHAMDAADSATFAMQSIDVDAVAAAQEWIATTEDDLDDGEGMGDRLFGLLAGIADENMDGEISEDEAEIVNVAANAVGDYLSAQGISDEEVAALLEDFDNDVAEAVHAQLSLAESEDDQMDEIDAFAFGAGDGAEEAAMDATYKRKIAVRKGKKVWVNKRVAGRVRLSAKQKRGLMKARRKAHSAKAVMRRAKSMKVRAQRGL